MTKREITRMLKDGELIKNGDMVPKCNGVLLEVNEYWWGKHVNYRCPIIVRRETVYYEGDK